MRRFTYITIVISVLLSLALAASANAAPARAAGNLALNKPATASSVESGTTLVAANAVDGNTATRWGSVDPATTAQWIYVDLGTTNSINHVVLNWEAAYASSYQVQVSNDASAWTTIFSTTTGNGGIDDLTGLSGSGRYVRVYCTVRGTSYGYSLWEFEVYAPSGPTNTPTNTQPAPTVTATPSPTQPGPSNTPTATRTATPTCACFTNTPTRTATLTQPAGSNLALNKPATASSVEVAGFEAAKAVDGNATTRWSSAFSDPQWIYVDLQATYNITHVKLTWEAAYGSAYQIQVSDNASTWTPIFSTTTGNGATDDLTGLSGSGRYVRMYGTARGTQWGYSLFEFEVYGSSGPTNTPGGPTNTPTRTATRTPTATATSGTGTGNFPARFSAPYQPTWVNPDLASLASSTGHKFWTLAFIINGSGTCNPMWNGDTALSNTWNVSGLRSAGGDVIISFGGASGVEIAASCTDVATTQAAYQKVINAMSAKAIDLDIESGYESDTVSIDRRNKAMHNLQVANPGLWVDYTLAVDRTGLPSAQINLLKNAVSNGVSIHAVNIMAMDYGPCYTDMGQAAVDAANATKNQLASNGISAKVGVTPMIGVNDTTCEVFSTSDAQLLVNFAQSNSFINLLAYWEQGADGNHSYINIFKTFH